MLVLGLETSTPRSSVCMGSERGLLASASLARGQAHGEFVAPAVAFCLEQAQTSMDAVNGVAVSLGPGLFTGMRVGIATAQALAHARGLPVVGMNSLDLLAYEARYVRGSRLVCAVLDARRGELYWAFYRPAHAGLQRVTDLRIGPPEKLAGEIEAVRESVLCIGDGAAAYHQLLRATGAECCGQWTPAPTAETLVELSLPRFVREETQRPEDLHPVYIRKADARINWRHRGALFGGTGSPRGQESEGAA